MFFGEKICLHLNGCSDWEWNFLENIFSTCMKTLSGRLMTHVWSGARNHRKDGQSTEIPFTPERWPFSSHFSIGVRSGPWRTLFNVSRIAKEHWNPESAEASFSQGPCCCELPSYSSDLSLFSVLLVSPLFVVISEDYSFKAIAKRKTFDGFQRRGRIMHLSELQVKNVTAVGTLFQIIYLILQWNIGPYSVLSKW